MEKLQNKTMFGRFKTHLTASSLLKLVWISIAKESVIQFIYLYTKHCESLNSHNTFVYETILIHGLHLDLLQRKLLKNFVILNFI